MGIKFVDLCNLCSIIDEYYVMEVNVKVCY